MKNAIQQTNIHQIANGIFKYRKDKIRILDFKPNSYQQYILTLKINNLNTENYKLAFYENQLTVILYESIEFNKPVHARNLKLKDLDENSFYDELTSIDFELPDNNFYLIGHKAFPKDGILKIMFGKINRN